MANRGLGRMQSKERLYYVDWLRVIAFALLIAYHSSVAFFPDMKLQEKGTRE